MLCDVFRRLWPFGRVEDYVYVGFGSVWFSDFALFHRALGVRDMVSIEHAVVARDRIEENKPFRIPVDYRSSTEALPDLDWQRNQFIWLDYDEPLSTNMLFDVRAVARRAKSGTALVVTIQCSKAPQVAQAEQDLVVGSPNALDRFVATFGRERIPQLTTEDELYGWQFGKLGRGMLLREVEAELAARNSTGDSEMAFRIICEIEYEDGAKMTTVVAVFHEVKDAARLTDCHFEGLDFLPIGGVGVRVEVPKLTVREFRKLESQLPLAEGAVLQLGTIPPGEAKHFAEMYRYLPNFAVVEG